MLRIVQETWRVCQSLKLKWHTTSCSCCEELTRTGIIIKAANNSNGQHTDKQNKNNEETENGNKTAILLFEVTDWQNFTLELLYIAKERNLLRETESLRIAAQKIAIGSNYVNAKIENKQQNCKCRLCGDRDDTINPISEYNNIAQKKCKTRRVLGWR